MAVRAIDANELYRIEKLLDTDIVRQDKVAFNLLEQVLYDIQHAPTLTPPNEPLTCKGDERATFLGRRRQRMVDRSTRGWKQNIHRRRGDS